MEKTIYLFITKPSYERVMIITATEKAIISFVFDLLRSGFTIRYSDVDEYNAFEPNEKGITFAGDVITSLAKSRGI